MTHELKDKEKWGVEEIKNRSQELAEIAIEVWTL